MKGRGIIRIVAMVILILAMLGIGAFAEGENDTPLMLHIELMLVQNGQPFLEETASIVLELTGQGVNGYEVMWRKTFGDAAILNGQVRLRLTGSDDNGKLLVSEMFDATNLKLNVTINNTSAQLDLIQQPYAIKSNMSDVAHNVTALQGVPIKYAENVQDGDLLVMKDGEWVVMGEDDGLSVMGNDATVSELVDLTDVRITNLGTGDILGFDGTQWVNTIDQQLGEREVDQIIEAAGYIKTVGEDIISPGVYNNIRGFGGKVKVDPMVQLLDQTTVSGDVMVGGDIGAAIFPVSKVQASRWVMKGDDINTEITASNNQLHLSTPATIAEKLGVVISGAGTENRLAVFQSSDELVAVDALIWDEAKKQLGLGALSDITSIKLNVDGGTRIDGEFFVKGEVLAIDDYVTFDELARVATTGVYEDLLDRPDLSELILADNLDAMLADALMNKSAVNADIDTRIGEFNDGRLITAFETALLPYDTTETFNEKLASEMADYYTRDAANDALVDNGELAATLQNYSTTQKIKEELLQPYMRSEGVSVIGTSGEFEDLVDEPSMVVSEDYEADKQTFENDFETKERMNAHVDDESERMRLGVLADVARNYVTKQQLIDEGFARQDTVLVLANVARSGQYSDLRNAPDLAPLMTRSLVTKDYQSAGDIGELLQGYVKREGLQPVVQSGSFFDLVDEPTMTDYMRVTDMENYVTDSSFNGDMMTVLKTDDVGTINLDGVLTTAFVSEELQKYAKKSDIATVAFTGKFNNLLGISSVITNGKLSRELLNYSTKIELNEERGRIDTVYYDDVEITARLNDLNSTIVAERNRELSDNYYSKTEGDAAIDAAIDTHHINTVSAAISSAVANVATNEHIDIELENMALKTELNAAVDAFETPYLTKAKYDGDKPIYSTMDYLHKRLPRGSILMWNRATIPDGWELCTNLNGRFIVGMGNGYNLNQTGGFNHITITKDQMPTHAHGASSTSKLGSHSHEGTSTSTETYDHDHTGTITDAGVKHKHTYSIGKQDTNHTHNFIINHKPGLTHAHGTNNGGHHKHTSIIATDRSTVNIIRNDDFNNTNPGLGNNEGNGASWQGGSIKNGYIYTGPAGGHNHPIPDETVSHPHALSTGNQLTSHRHLARITDTSSAHEHNISGINNVTRAHNHTVTVTGEDMKHNHSITVDALGGGQSYDNRPPYYALKFIKKL